MKLGQTAIHRVESRHADTVAGIDTHPIRPDAAHAHPHRDAANAARAGVVRAVLWDFGGVFTTSPFDAFRTYEHDHDLPAGFLRQVNATNSDDNAWARLERSEIGRDEFDARFADESDALGHRVRGADVLALLDGSIRPRMVAALDTVRAAGYRTACLTNNMHSNRAPSTERRALLDRFDAVIESARVGMRKPELAFYRLACTELGVDARECVFLDDLGVNLKPAAALGMRTIKVLDEAQACRDLGDILGLDL